MVYRKSKVYLTKLNSALKTANLRLLPYLKRIRYNQYLQVWYLADGGRIVKIEGYTMTSYKGMFGLIWVREVDTGRKFGFLPTSPRLLLVR